MDYTHAYLELSESNLTLFRSRLIIYSVLMVKILATVAEWVARQI
jgi:hypothetical protein